MIYETLVKIGLVYVCIWVAIELKSRDSHTFLANKFKERNMFVAESFNSDVIKIMENIQFLQMVANGIHNPKFLHVYHHVHSSLEKSLIEGLCSISMIELSFDEYFPNTIKNCKLKHIQNWLNLFVNYYNQEVTHA